MAEMFYVLPQSDPDARETQEWLEALDAVIAQEGPERAHYLIQRLIESAREEGIDIPYSANTAYINTHSYRTAAELPWRCGDGRAHPVRGCAGMRWPRYGRCQSRQLQCGRPHCVVCLLHDPV